MDFGIGQDELLLDEEARQRREHRRREEEERARRVAGMAACEAGRKFFEEYFRRARIFEPLAPDPAATALHNEALEWLRVLARANPAVCTRIVMNGLMDGDAE